jgi:glycosyltransferase involved in cell wall biosynthesis
VNKLIYIANNRLPTEKAHGLQIVQMCEALSDVAYDVTLVTPRRVNTPEMAALRMSLWEYYGVTPNFAFRRLPCLDLFRLFPRYQVAFIIQTFTYLLSLLVWLRFRRADVLYTRDLFVGVVMALVRPRTKLVYEVHQMHKSHLGIRAQSFIVRRAYTVPITHHLADRLWALGARRVSVEHDGLRLKRFENLPTRNAARAALGLDPGAFVIGYAGQLHTMQLPKGLDTLVDAIARATEDDTVVDLLLVGGPEEGAQVIRKRWQARGLPLERLHAVGQVLPTDVPRHLAAMDVGVMPLPWTEHFAYYASALKLFEYMAAGCAVLASALPSTAEIVQDGRTALLVPAGDVAAFADAIRRLYSDRELARKLGEQAQADVHQYSWAARAVRIRAFIEGAK